MDAWTGTGARHIQKAYPIIRYAEILLSYAEALNNLTGPHTVELDGQPYTMSRDKEEIKSIQSSPLQGRTAGADSQSTQQYAGSTETDRTRTYGRVFMGKQTFL